MKLEFMAGLLGKPVEELKNSLTLTDSGEVLEDQAEKLIKDWIAVEKLNAKQSGISEGKSQGEGMVKRLTMTDVEKKLKDAGIEGKSFEDQLQNLKKPTDNTELQKKLDVLKVKYEEAEKEKTQLFDKFTRQQIERGVTKKLTGIIEKFTFATDHVKLMSIENFVTTHKFMENEGDIFLLDSENKPTAKFDEKAVEHFSKWGVQSTKNLPGHQKPGEKPNYGESPEELYTALRNAKTPEELAAITEKLNKLDNLK